MVADAAEDCGDAAVEVGGDLSLAVAVFVGVGDGDAGWCEPVLFEWWEGWGEVVARVFGATFDASEVVDDERVVAVENRVGLGGSCSWWMSVR